MKQVKGDLGISRKLIAGVQPVRDVTGPVSLTSASGSHVRFLNTSGVTHNVSLPLALDSELSQHMVLSNLGTSANNIQIQTENTTLDAVLTLRPGSSVFFIFNGTSWQLTGGAGEEVSHSALTDRDVAGNHARLIPLEDGSTAIQITKADGTTAVINVDTLSADPRVTVTGQLKTYATDNEDDGDNIQNNGMILDGPEDTDKQILFQDGGVDKWALQGAWRDEKGEYFYLYNLTSGENIMITSENGRVAFNKPTDIIMESAAFVGTGLNDLTPSGLYTEKVIRGFNFEIDGEGTPDTFKWSVTLDGVTFTEQAAGVPIVAGPIALDWGISITFGATTGHTAGDKWSFRAQPVLPQNTLELRPPMLTHVLEYDGVNYTEQSYLASTVHCSIGGNFDILDSTTNWLFLGNTSKFNSCYFLLDQLASGVTLVVEYWNGTEWTALTAGSNRLSDRTQNLTRDGVLQWDKSTMEDWAPGEVNGLTDYWLRLRTATNPATAATIKAITRHAEYRLGVYSAFNDTRRAFGVRGNGITEVFKAERLSTAESYRSNELITEARLRSQFSLLIEKAEYFTDTALGDYRLMEEDIPAAGFSVSALINTNDPVTVGTWISEEPFGMDVVAGDRFEAYVFFQRTASKREIKVYAELLRWQDGTPPSVTVIATSNSITAPATTGIEAYNFYFNTEAQTMDPTDRLGVRIVVLRQSPHTQTATIWGGPSYPSVFDYPSDAVTLDRLLEHFEESTSGVRSQWKAKGSGTDIDIELMPKGAGALRTPAVLIMEQEGYAREFVSVNSGTVTRDLEGEIEEISVTGGRTLTISRNVDGTINTVSDGVRLWTFTYTDELLTSWDVEVI